MCIVWLAVSFNYYMVSFLLKYFPGSIYVNTTCSSISDVLGNMMGGFLFSYFGVKKSLGLSFAMSFLGGLSIVYYELNTNFYSSTPSQTAAMLFPMLVLIAKLGLTSIYNINYLANPHLFPVLFASRALGYCNFLARFSTIFAPQVAEIQSLVPMTIFTCLCCLGFVASQFLRAEE